MENKFTVRSEYPALTVGNSLSYNPAEEITWPSRTLRIAIAKGDSYQVLSSQS